MKRFATQDSALRTRRYFTLVTSTGSFAACQEFQPPTRAAAFVTPMFLRSSTARALVCSAVQAQYVMIIRPFGMSLSFLLKSEPLMFNAPLM